ncbi:MAG: HIRAN protein [Betaproteobacteria bacterium]|nr:HIRAN protein [Betaproteobacteria bacterium]
MAAIGVAFVLALAGSAQAQSVRMLVQSSPLAGIRHHEAAQLWHLLGVGDSLELVREPDNPHDPRAIRVDWRGHKLGYVPRRDNDAIAWGMDRGDTLLAKISRIEARGTVPRRIEFEVFVD